MEKQSNSCLLHFRVVFDCVRGSVRFRCFRNWCQSFIKHLLDQRDFFCSSQLGSPLSHDSELHLEQLLGNRCSRCSW